MTFRLQACFFKQVPSTLQICLRGCQFEGLQFYNTGFGQLLKASIGQSVSCYDCLRKCQSSHLSSIGSCSIHSAYSPPCRSSIHTDSPGSPTDLLGGSNPSLRWRHSEGSSPQLISLCFAGPCRGHSSNALSKSMSRKGFRWKTVEYEATEQISSTEMCGAGGVEIRVSRRVSRRTKRAETEVVRREALQQAEDKQGKEEEEEDGRNEPRESIKGQEEGNAENGRTATQEEEEELAIAELTTGIACLGRDNVALQTAALVVGIDPDVSGALAVLRLNHEEITAEVMDVPFVMTKVGKRQRRRHDAISIAAMLQSLEAPPGSVAYIEQSVPFPKDGKQSWYGAGYGYGMWVGTLAATGFTVVPVAACRWKRALGLAGRQFTKDESRALAASFFPMIASQLKRKKDHGRAEALLIAAWGRGYRSPNSSEEADKTSEETSEPDRQSVTEADMTSEEIVDQQTVMGTERINDETSEQEVDSVNGVGSLVAAQR